MEKGMVVLQKIIIAQQWRFTASRQLAVQLAGLLFLHLNILWGWDIHNQHKGCKSRLSVWRWWKLLVIWGGRFPLNLSPLIIEMLKNEKKKRRENWSHLVQPCQPINTFHSVWPQWRHHAGIWHHVRKQSNKSLIWIN